jgi:hypothetical protein
VTGAAAAMLRRAGRMAAGALPAVVLAGLGLPALAAVVFLAVAALVTTCWVIASGDRTNRVSQLMRAWRGQADCLTSATSLVSVPGPGTPSPTGHGRPGRPAARMRGLFRRPGPAVGAR